MGLRYLGGPTRHALIAVDMTQPGAAFDRSCGGDDEGLSGGRELVIYYSLGGD